MLGKLDHDRLAFQYGLEHQVLTTPGVELAKCVGESASGLRCLPTPHEDHTHTQQRHNTFASGGCSLITVMMCMPSQYQTLMQFMVCANAREGLTAIPTLLLRGIN